MKIIKRKFIKYVGFSILSVIFHPFNSLLLAATKKVINPNLSNQQKDVMFNEGTEKPFSSELLNEKEKGFTIVQIVGLNCFLLNQNLIVEPDGLLFQKHCQELLKPK